MKIVTIQNHLANRNKNTHGDKGELITPNGHPVMRLIKKFQKQMHMLVHQKVEREIKDLKDNFLFMQSETEQLGE